MDTKLACGAHMDTQAKTLMNLLKFSRETESYYVALADLELAVEHQIGLELSSTCASTSRVLEL